MHNAEWLKGYAGALSKASWKCIRFARKKAPFKAQLRPLQDDQKVSAA